MNQRATADPVDNVRRDAKDGAYHCPQCDTPFTRRSNLRRHFQIHTRNALLKCDTCPEEFATKQELQHHAGTCYSIGWNHADDRTFRALESAFINDVHSDNPAALSGSQTMNSFLYGSNYASPATLFPDFDSTTRYPGPYHAPDLGLMSPLSSTAAVLSPAHTTTASYDGNLTSLSSLQGFSHRRPSTPSSSISSSSNSSSSPYSKTHSNFAHWNGGVPASPINPGDEPVYSRKQVKDMIDVVSECLIDTMENVMTRTQPTSHGPFDTPDKQLVSSMRDAGFRQTVISEAIPRVFYKIHTRGNDGL